MFEGVTAVILAGGLGSRLLDAWQGPKILMPLGNGLRFIDYLVNEVVSFGVREIVFCLGHKANEVVQYLETRDYDTICEFKFVIEEYPLGTGGAVNNALRYIGTSHILALNGDTYYIDSSSIRPVGVLEENKGVIFVARVSENSRFCEVKKNLSDRVEFLRGSDEHVLYNSDVFAGIAVLPSVRLNLARQTFSFEEYIEALSKYGVSLDLVYLRDGFIDCGVPADLRKVQKLFEKIGGEESGEA